MRGRFAADRPKGLRRTPRRSGKGFGLRGQSAHCRCRIAEKHLVGHGSSRGNSETGAVGEKMEENSLGARRRGRGVTMRAISSLDRLQAQSIWEMSAYGDVLACRHRHGSGRQASESRDQYALPRTLGPSKPHPQPITKGNKPPKPPHPTPRRQRPKGLVGGEGGARMGCTMG